MALFMTPNSITKQSKYPNNPITSNILVIPVFANV